MLVGDEDTNRLRRPDLMEANQPWARLELADGHCRDAAATRPPWPSPVRGIWLDVSGEIRRPMAAGRTSDGRAGALPDPSSPSIEPAPDVIGIEPERLADALERERPLTVVAREPGHDFSQALGGDPVARRERLQIEVDGIAQDSEHQSVSSRFPCTALSTPGDLLGKDERGLEKIVDGMAQVHDFAFVHGSCLTDCKDWRACDDSDLQRRVQSTTTVFPKWPSVEVHELH